MNLSLKFKFHKSNIRALYALLISFKQIDMKLIALNPLIKLLALFLVIESTEIIHVASC